MAAFPSEQFKQWFLTRRRDLPWRGDPTPYEVWVSEIMLQQTQVAVVIPYFQRWMAQFPHVRALASAEIEQVLKAWEGLGYYSRARNLHRAAQQIVEEWNGEIPNDPTLLASLPGLGPYTVGAIRAFAFKQRAAAVDGNVLRVLARYLGEQEEIDRPAVQKRIREQAEALLPKSEPWLVAEGLIELGATVCGRTPVCAKCPLQHQCQAFIGGMADRLPKRKERKQVTALVRDVAIIHCDDHWLLQRGGEGKVMADLYEFPYWEGGRAVASLQLMSERLGLPLTCHGALPHITHGFTRYKATLRPVIYESSSLDDVPGLAWYKWDQLQLFPFSAGHRKLRDQIERLCYA